MVFALQEKRTAKRPQVRALLGKFLAKYSSSFSDLWPLFQVSKAGGSLVPVSPGASLSEIRNTIVHGDVFAATDFPALSYAAQNLEWILERIILTSLGWDINHSTVSPQALKNYSASQWQSIQARFTV